MNRFNSYEVSRSQPDSFKLRMLSETQLYMVQKDLELLRQFKTVISEDEEELPDLSKIPVTADLSADQKDNYIFESGIINALLNPPFSDNQQLFERAVKILKRVKLLTERNSRIGMLAASIAKSLFNTLPQFSGTIILPPSHPAKDLLEKIAENAVLTATTGVIGGVRRNYLIPDLHYIVRNTTGDNVVKEMAAKQFGTGISEAILHIFRTAFRGIAKAGKKEFLELLSQVEKHLLRKQKSIRKRLRCLINLDLREKNRCITRSLHVYTNDGKDADSDLFFDGIVKENLSGKPFKHRSQWQTIKTSSRGNYNGYWRLLQPLRAKAA